MGVLPPMEFPGGEPVNPDKDQPVVELRNVSLSYQLSLGMSVSVKQHALDVIRRRVERRDIWALRDVNVMAHRGEVLAVLGPNGAGKSSMMKLIARVLAPTRGRVLVRGLLAPMIELGAGFNPELTGAENVILYGSILGRDPSKVKKRVPAIAAWAGLEERMDAPLRTYSSGMVARLAFSTAVDVSPDVLLVDEVLSVGDEAFQRRCHERINEMVNSGACVILVTHDMDQVVARASRAIFLSDGEIHATGDPVSVVAAYRRSQSALASDT